MGWQLSGRYFESCNCDAICPCRMIGGVPGGRSTYGICEGALSWAIDEGRADDVDLSGLTAVLVYRYDDDEEQSPWDLVLHVDERGDEAQRSAIAEILLGERGGDDVLRLPWIRKPRRMIGVRASPIEIEHTADAHTVRIPSAVTVRAATAFPTDDVVRCIVPGYETPGGIELVADELAVDDEPFSWQHAGNCAFASRFDYRG